MLESSLLLGDLPGSGGSVALHVLLAGLSNIANVDISASTQNMERNSVCGLRG